MISKITSIRSGILLSLLATFFFSLTNLLTKLISSQVPFTQIACSRSLIGLIIVVGYMLWAGRTFKVKKKKILFLRGLLGGAALLCSFYAISKIKLGEVSVLYQLSPVFISVFAHLMLGEKLPRFFYLLLILSLAGCILVIKPTMSNLGNIPAFVAVLSAVLVALAYVCIRALSKEHKTHIIVLYFSFTAAIIPLPWVSYFIIPNSYQLLILLAIGVVATIAQFFVTKAYGAEKAGIVSMISYTSVFFNVLWGILIWKEYLDVYSVIGGVMILSSCVILSLSVHYNKKTIVPVVPGD
ncbi:MAG: DMT family transporter [Proteobacteria bacterium]|nr:DMT family transporter [Pseudomonadota bacterium]